jgi:phosphopantothenoylcysteine synthetase/decarboxylase
MNLLVTAGNTLVPIDRVRCITNVFTGRTGASLALCAHGRGHCVTLLTSHPELVDVPPGGERWEVRAYRTFDDLQREMESRIRAGGLDGVIHCAAVSDYLSGGIFAPAEGTCFDPETGAWRAEEGSPTLLDRAAGKVKSDEPELWLRLVRAPKLVDQIRNPWGFAGVLVKFKLEVGVSDEQLLEVAERSRRASAADLMVANTLEGASTVAFLGPVEGGYQRIYRRALPARLLEAVEGLHEGRTNG